MEKLIERDSFFDGMNTLYVTDSLTQVFNREIAMSYINHLIELKRPFSVMILDLDNFKYINDSFGHIIGDRVLKKSAVRLKTDLYETGIVARFGGDEFIIVIPDVVEYDDVWKNCRAISMGSRTLSMEELRGTSITYTIGVARFPIDGESMDELQEKINVALYRGKHKGRNCFIIYLHEKHKEIEKNSFEGVKFNSMMMHANIANMLTFSKDFAANINQLVKFLSNNLMIDHLCIQSMKGIKYSNIYFLSYSKVFDYVPSELLNGCINSSGICYINNIKEFVKQGNNELYDRLRVQGVTATAFVRIEAYGEVFGFIRADGTNQDGRLWQNYELDYMIMFARMLGLILYDRKLDLDEMYQ